MHTHTLKSLLVILLAVVFQTSAAQQRKLSMEEMVRMNNTPRNFIKPGGPAATFSRLKGNSITKKISPKKTQPASDISRTTQSACPDTSLSRPFESDQRIFSFWCSAKTKEGGMLIGGWGRQQNIGPPYLLMGVISKFDRLGNHLWSKEVSSDVRYAVSIETITELSDGTILICGTHNNAVYFDGNKEYHDYFVSKLSRTGDIIWFKTFHQQLPSSCTTANVYSSSVAEGKNGDILITGTIWNCPLPKYLLVLKLNSNGELQWKYSFLDAVVGDAFGVGIFYENDEVVLINKSSNFGSTGDNVTHVDFMRLNYNTGSFINQKSWKVDKNPLESFYYGFINSVRAVKQNNGNYVVYGQTFGDLQQNGSYQPKLAILEFDSRFEFLNGYTINSTLATNYSETRINVNASGLAAFGFSTILPTGDEDKFIGSSKRGELLHQRKKEFRNYLYLHDNVEVFEDDSYAYIHNLASGNQTKYYLQYNLLHNTDTGSICLGLNASFATIENVKFVPYNASWVGINPNPILETLNRSNSTADIGYDESTACLQYSQCESINISGDSIACDTGHVFEFKAFLPRNCGANVRWRFDTAAVMSSTETDDSTIQIVFKQKWQGKLYADINTSCGVLSDSIEIIYSPQLSVLNIGNDTLLCEGNQMMLNAGNMFDSYLWNNGSTDSAIIINAPGKYFVSAINKCGINKNDTIVVLPSPAVTLNIGNDTTLCANQPLILTGPENFISYQWGPDYNLSSTTGQETEVRPQTDTVYYLKAERQAGCFGYDTIHIKVKPAPLLLLPADTSLCTGDTLTLDAGSGFDNYQWSNGSTDRIIKVSEQKNYIVTASTAEGCSATDSISILYIWPVPTVNFNTISGICKGDQIVLDAGNFSTFLWQDSSTARQFIVTTTGLYSVAVTDTHGCRGGNTIAINSVFDPPANFLSADTSLCRYETLIIQATRSFSSYLWSTGSSTESIVVNTAGKYGLSVKDVNGCSGNDSIFISQKDCLEGFNMPNAFTPNNDRLNDVFKPLIGGKLIIFRLSIYNRWGEIIYSSNDHLKGWDGRFRGLLQNPGRYIWVCTYQLEGQLPQNKKGTVTLIR